MSKETKDSPKGPKTGNGMVRKMNAPFYKVVAGGCNIDWTDKVGEAMSSFKNSGALPKTVFQLSAGGGVSVVAHYSENSKA